MKIVKSTITTITVKRQTEDVKFDMKETKHGKEE